MTSSETRIEIDSMGEMHVPAWALWGASTQRARENFPIAHRGVPAEVVHAFGHLKAACAQANADLGKLDKTLAEPIIAAATEVAEGKLDDHFVVDVYQTGSGTSTNMNANEVIANRAKQLGEQAVHPNDHVNMGQSSNDTFPTAMHIAAVLTVHRKLWPALGQLCTSLGEKAEQWDRVVKIGRTHLMDATPIRVGQVFSGYEDQAHLAVQLAEDIKHNLARQMPIGGTAVGTGINTHPEFARRVCRALTERTGISASESPAFSFSETDNHFSCQAAKDYFVDAHGQLKTIAVSLSKIANDIRWLGSGPRCGLGELQLPAIQPGSSIMPGKVNPVISEAMIQVCTRVIGNDATITTAGLGGVGSIFELNVAMPVMADAMMESINLLANVSNVFVDKLLTGLEVNRERTEGLVEQSLMMCTSLAPEIGYDNAARLAKQAFAESKTIRELVLEQKLIPEARLNELLDPRRMTEPDAAGA